jgi:hypothetical protein
MGRVDRSRRTESGGCARGDTEQRLAGEFSELFATAIITEAREGSRLAERAEAITAVAALVTAGAPLEVFEARYGEVGAYLRADSLPPHEDGGITAWRRTVRGGYRRRQRFTARRRRVGPALTEIGPARTSRSYREAPGEAALDAATQMGWRARRWNPITVEDHTGRWRSSRQTSTPRADWPVAALRPDHNETRHFEKARASPTNRRRGRAAIVAEGRLRTECSKASEMR